MNEVYSMVACLVATMKERAAFTAVVVVVCLSTAIAQESAPAKAYLVGEAYQVYSVLLPQEESYGFAKDTLVIQQETVQKTVLDQWPLGACLTAKAADKFKDAISDFDRANSQGWLLQRQFEMQKPYELVSSNAIRLSFKEHSKGWDGFYERYPGSGGYVTLSAVGFNKDQTQAIVYAGSTCGNLCGRWSFHLLEKVGGKWQEVRGVTCTTVSQNRHITTGKTNF